MIEVEDLCVTFNVGSAIETRALRKLQLTIPAGQFVTVIGSNGAGKSTLLNVIAGEIRCDSGRILIDGRDVTHWSTARRSALVARVFQDPMAGSCENLTLEENLALASSRGARRGLGPAVNRDRHDEFQQRLAQLGLGLDNRLNDRMGLLSGGQRQAVSLVMATLNPMKILLLDEHTAALDPKTAAFVMELTERIVQDLSLTTMMVTHSMRQALDHGHRTLMLHEGRVVLDVEGDERRRMKVEDLLHMFEQVRGVALDDDKLLFG
ncbi:MAG: ABC transporter ATP-binding protein [Gammaproteobacteria bacterium]|nr:ABC transporter ATP-binding protein [Gammaproteobacteria bacterium]